MQRVADFERRHHRVPFAHHQCRAEASQRERCEIAPLVREAQPRFAPEYLGLSPQERRKQEQRKQEQRKQEQANRSKQTGASKQEQANTSAP